MAKLAIPFAKCARCNGPVGVSDSETIEIGGVEMLICAECASADNEKVATDNSR